MSKIKLNDLLRIKDEDLPNVKIRLNLSNGNYNAMENYHHDKKALLIGNFYNSETRHWFREGQIVIGLAAMGEDKWLLFDISRITKDKNRDAFKGAGPYDFYDHEPVAEYEKYFGRVIVKFHKDNAYVTLSGNKIDRFDIYEILPKEYQEADRFPGYDKVDISWTELRHALKKESWKTALENQKGVYLITDTLTNKRYVGSATGKDMILGRWQTYAKNGHGGNVELVKLVKEQGLEYVEKNFRYSILDIYKATTDDSIITDREKWWKKVLLTKNAEFGYNANY